jgi:site-specific DNA-methyltransferase (adenine-specific)
MYLGDCREILPTISADAIVTDPPYGVTDHAWDVVVHPRDWMAAPCAIATASEPYATQLITQSPLPFRFDFVWVKNCASNAMNAKLMPMRRHERVLLFGDYAYNPQKRRRTTDELKRLNATQRQTMEFASPDSVLEFDSVNSRSGEREPHPSQKPVDLIQYLVLSLTAGTVCDPFAGSGTTGVACANLGRSFIGIEREREFFDIACERIAAAQSQGRLFA